MAGQRNHPAARGGVSTIEGRPQLYEHQGLYQLLADVNPKNHGFPAGQRPRVASAHRDHTHAVSQSVHRQTWRPSSAPLVHSVYSAQQQHPMHEGAKNLLKVNSLHLEAHAEEPNSQILLANPARRARPKSACVTAAAWKAYGSPQLRGVTKEPPPPAPIHPKARAKGPEAALSRTPAVGILGGGYRYPCAQVPTVGPTGITTSIINNSSQPHSGYPGNYRQQSWQVGMMEAHSVANSTNSTDEYRFTHTQPTDPGSQRMLLKMLADHPTVESVSGRLRRPQSAHTSFPSQAGRVNNVAGSGISNYSSRSRPLSATPVQRLTSTSVGKAQKLGCKFTPTTVCGHLRPEREFVVPPPEDNSWMYCRMGHTALSRLVAGCKMPLQLTDDTPIMSRTVEDLPLSSTTQSHPKGQSFAQPIEATALSFPEGKVVESADTSGVSGSLLTRQAAVLEQLMAELNDAEPSEADRDVVHEATGQLGPPQPMIGLDEDMFAQPEAESQHMSAFRSSRQNNSQTSSLEATPQINGDDSRFPTAEERHPYCEVEWIEQNEAVDNTDQVCTTRPSSANHLRPGSAQPRYSGGAAGTAYPAAADMYAIEEHSGEDEDVMVDL